ncbi:MAG: hypothetical protein OEY28_04950 [Nitrospira sp.]|nr:hypothetical protein [Nitrospira sp.]
MARKRTLDDVLVELDGQLVAVGALPPARWLVICFEMRQTGDGWEYRPAGEPWGYSVPFDREEEMYEQMADDYRLIEAAARSA